MIDTQVRKLHTLMERKAHHKYFEIGISPVAIDTGSVRGLESGDILLLETERLGITVFDEGEAVAEGSFGLDGGEKSIRIEKVTKKKPKVKNTKNNAYLEVLLGKVEKARLEKGMLIALKDTKTHDAILRYRGVAFAEADFVYVKKQIALQVRKVYHHG